ncbi:hypothetical protein FBQ84_03955 [Ignavibacteria bacterium CHB1]|jgi:hypothetical protein|nr:MAG: hypothetical protein EDM69_04565 [Chlorobiota bacterium]KXK04900.1 MAG: hypothetical protein UZ04_CHB001000788 [Chlorobi bacterium OLB4]MBV6397717.1 hypothetical protein [Ignavibacteria bacterium]MCC6885497.1 hypothetical protein [Ignavibacteriales bacterium]MCE7952849.1 hypothetical protein [Chlorobi bacterium CHB7]MDL1886984.1 hypothetical protein [Ignavibacteria bacterium CHB1]OQY79084.1 MAG: hypothetical protein B6D43_00360 [Ignavibacteriales bacterium UTCHB1]RIK49608.1 MAG: hypo
MKKAVSILLLLTFLTIGSLLSQTKRDTTISGKLHSDETDLITLTCNLELYDSVWYLQQNYVLKINNHEFLREVELYDEIPELYLVDLDVEDNFIEVAVRIPSFYFLYYDIYRFNGDEIKFLGEIPSIGDVTFWGNNDITAPQYMGFWELTGDFQLTGDSISPVVKESYTPELFWDKEILATEKITLHVEKNDDSQTTTIEPGETIEIIKVDIREHCEEEIIQYPFTNSDCSWYYLKSSSGKTGWVRLKNFMDKVEGLSWAG